MVRAPWIAAIILPVLLTSFHQPATAGEEHQSYCKTRNLGASDWKSVVALGEKNENSTTTLCPESCYPDCIADPSVLGMACYTGNCPEALPAPGRGVHLAMVSGAWRTGYEGWEVEVGFGDMRPLNLLTRARLSPDRKTLRMFFPSNQMFSDFTQVKNGEYLLGSNASMVPPGSVVALDADGKKATLRLSDGQQWDFEHSGAFQGGDVFRKTRTVERQGWTTRYEYGPEAVVITDAAGNRYDIRHGADGRITQIDVADRVWRYEYTPGKVTEIEPFGARTTVAVGNANRFAGVERDGGPMGGRRTTRVDIDDRGLITAAWDGQEKIAVQETLDGDHWTIAVDAGGVRKGMKREPGGLAWSVDGNDGRAASESRWATLSDTGERVDALGRAWRKTHDGNGRVTREVSPSGMETRYAYDDRGNQILRLTPEGAWRYEYNARNLVVSETSPSGAVTRYEYDDATGQVSRQIDALGHITRYEYDPRGLLTAVAGPYAPGEKEPPASRYAYDHYGNRVAETDELGATTRYEYDLANNLTKRTDAAGNATRYEYDGLRRKVKEIDALGGTTEWVYDDRGLVVEVKGSVAASGGHGGCRSCGGAAGVYEKPGKYEYNAARMLTKYTDLLGHATNYEYNDLGQQVAVTDALGAVTKMDYDLVGNLLARTDPMGNTTHYEYDALGQMVATVNPLGARTQYVYDAEGRQIAVIGPDGGTQRSEYDALGRLSRIIAANGGVTAYEYNPAGQMIRQTNAAGMVTEYAYDSDGRRVQTVADAKGFRQTVRSEYNAGGQLAASYNPLDRVTRYEYDANGQLVKTISPGGAVSAFAYDVLGRRIRVTDPAGRVATSEYVPGGQELVASGRGGPAVTWYTYDELGRRLTTEGLDRAKEEYVYDAVGRMVEIRVAGSVTRRQYDLAGNLIASTDPLGNTTTFTYNAAGQLTATTDPLGATTRHEYDIASRPVKTFMPEGGVRESIYNKAGRLVETRGGPEGIKRYEYDLLGRQTAVIDANNRRKTTKYDTLGRVVRIANEMDQPVLYEYDLAGNRIGLTDANGNKTVWEYDVDGRQTSMTFPNGDREEYKYDAGGKLVEKKTPNGEFIRNAYDPKTGFLVRVDVEGDVPYVRELYMGLWEEAKQAGLNLGELNFAERNFSVVYTRDEQGRTLTETCPQTTMRHVYNEKGQLQSVTDTALNATLHYEYDERGLRRRLSSNLSEEVNYTHDAAGRVISVAGHSEAYAKYDYSESGLLRSIQYANGLIVDYRYNDLNRLLEERLSKIGSVTAVDKNTDEHTRKQLIYSKQYGYDDIGNMVNAIDSDKLHAKYLYDDAGSLIREVVLDGNDVVRFYETNKYDPTGNILERVRNDIFSAYRYNAANQSNLKTQKYTPVLFNNPPLDLNTTKYIYWPATSFSATTRTDWKDYVWQFNSGLAISRNYAVQNSVYDRNGNQVKVARYITNNNGERLELMTVYCAYDSMNRLMSCVKKYPEGIGETKTKYRGGSWFAHQQSLSYGASDLNQFQIRSIVHDGLNQLIELQGEEIRFNVMTDLDRICVSREHPRYLNATPGASLTKYMIQDYRNSVTHVFGEKGEVLERILYSAFGLPFNIEHKVTENALYANRPRITDDYVNMRYRVYDPDSGTFIQRDPIKYLGGVNVYQYVRNNPLSYGDPLGLGPCANQCDIAESPRGLTYRGMTYSHGTAKIPPNSSLMEAYKNVVMITTLINNATNPAEWMNALIQNQIQPDAAAIANSIANLESALVDRHGVALWTIIEGQCCKKKSCCMVFWQNRFTTHKYTHACSYGDETFGVGFPAFQKGNITAMANAMPHCIYDAFASFRCDMISNTGDL